MLNIKSMMVATTLSLISFSSCTKNTVKVEEKVTITQPTVEDVVNAELPVGQSDIIPHSKEEDCHGVRKTIMRLENKEGTIMKIGNTYLISMEPGTRRYKPCEIGEEFMDESKKVIFSGVVLEIFPNERLMGTPFRLESMRVVE